MTSYSPKSIWARTPSWGINIKANWGIFRRSHFFVVFPSFTPNKFQPEVLAVLEHPFLAKFHEDLARISAIRTLPSANTNNVTVAAFAVVEALLPLLFVLLSSSRAVHHGDYLHMVF
ncbi:hypothetical protein QTG54_007968 [Skeletonema marinoi]|uniref:Uncharacterized protein n=1 Tax=Skeletonema marinoi TaxID=267567 RepID=A0AAD8Y9H5_9STRA|nr:hypothetical protein QTG54_007968 [Skeletonema marinoi]